MFAEQALLEHVFGVTPVTDWEIGLYMAGFDPVTALDSGEVLGSRASLADKLAWDTDALKNQQEISCGPIAACTVGGWFIAATGSTDVTWHQEFPAPLVVPSENSVVFPTGTISINIG